MTKHRNGTRTTRRSGRVACRHLEIECLEDRTLLATLGVGASSQYASIQAAVDNARSYDHILVEDGIYSESVDLSRMGSAIGTGAGNLTIRGTSTNGTVLRSPAGPSLFTSLAFSGRVRIERMTVESPTGAADSLGMDFEQFDGVLDVVDILFQDISATGIELTEFSGRFSVVDSQFLGVGDDNGDDAVRIGGLEGRGTITNNTMQNTAGVAIRLQNSGAKQATLMVNDNTIQGDDAFFSTTDVGVLAELRGDTRSDLTLDNNHLEHLAQEAIDVQIYDNAELQTRWSRNVARNINGESVMRLGLHDASRVAAGMLSQSVTDVFGDGMLIELEGDSSLNAVIRHNLFLSVGDGADDDALTIVSSPEATGTVNAVLEKNDFVTVSGVGLHLAADGATTFNAAVLENFFTELNTMGGDSAFIADQVSEDASATVNLILDNNTLLDSAMGAYTLNQRGAGELNLEGTSIDVLTQIELTNIGEPNYSTGTVNLVPEGSFAGSAPLLAGEEIWVDTNGDGIHDEAELGFPNALISLTGTETSSGDSVSWMTQTDSIGVYTFSALLPGTYTLTVDVPFAHMLTVPNQGGDDTVDSDFEQQSAQVAVTLAPTNDDLSINAGLLTTWQNPANQYDVNNDGSITPLDVLEVILDINTNNVRELPIPIVPPDEPPPYVDVSGDGNLAPLDVLLVISFLNAVGPGPAALAEGEGESVHGGLANDAIIPDTTQPRLAVQAEPSHFTPDRQTPRHDYAVRPDRRESYRDSLSSRGFARDSAENGTDAVWPNGPTELPWEIALAEVLSDDLGTPELFFRDPR